MNKGQLRAAGTFALNKKESLHRWYPYLEGYSFCLIEDVISEIGTENLHKIYDPFCGTGTTALVASSKGIKSCYTESNPFMQCVIESKINAVKRLRDSGVKGKFLKQFIEEISNNQLYLYSDECKWEGFEKFFDNDVLIQIKELYKAASMISDTDTKLIAKVLLAAIIVRSSNMIRQGDLRFAKDSEKKTEDKDVLGNYIQKLEEAIEDIENEYCKTLSETIRLADDARDIDITDEIDCVITSPPYLNGTNYIRNTKLELKLLEFIDSEKDLPLFHSKGIIAGINNVSKRNSDIPILDIIKPYLEQLEPVAYDKRIPIMVAGYFSDMKKVISKLSVAIKEDGYFIMDIGDSQFAGVHIPTHEILKKICLEYGFVLYEEKILRERRSKNGMVLSQRLLKFRLKKRNGRQFESKDISTIDGLELKQYKNEAERFIQEMPYKQEPFSGRNWGHSWHSLCSYHGKLKPAIAHFLVERFTKKGDVVLDPLCGVGTIPLEASLQGRIGIGNDLSQLAYIVTKAKLEKPTRDDTLNALGSLSEFISSEIGSQQINNEVCKYSEFGYNGKLPSYFHEDTFREIICARRYFINKINDISPADAMVFSCFLHVLHGNRPYALSRCSHPLTPYAPKGEFVYKNVIEHIKAKIEASYKKSDFDDYLYGKAIWGSYENLDVSSVSADVIICSPPFVDSIKFYMQNWMRLWLCGWESDDFKNADTIFIDQKQKKDFGVYRSFFEMCYKVLKPKGKVILHLGRTAKYDMAEELSSQASPFFNEVYRGEEDVQNIEKHGIKDKGGTLVHQYLFLEKK